MGISGYKIHLYILILEVIFLGKRGTVEDIKFHYALYITINSNFNVTKKGTIMIYHWEYGEYEG